MDNMQRLVSFLIKLDDSKIYYHLERARDSIMVEVTIPGQRWEVEFMIDGTIQIEKFVTENIIYDERELETLFRLYSD